MDPADWECMGQGVDSPRNDIAQEGALDGKLDC
jgi:hypothetical protein